jgi:antirestriction protein ArdC
METERFDIHQHITDQIIAAIERSAGEFRLPWHRSAGNIMRPVNVSSKKPHRGVNILTLWATADEKGYTSGAWGTYKQWAEAGAQSARARRPPISSSTRKSPSPRTSPTATKPKLKCFIAVVAAADRLGVSG